MVQTTDTSKTRDDVGKLSSPKNQRKWLLPLLVGLGILGSIALIPQAEDATLLSAWTTILMYCALAQSWNFIGGFVGYSAFGNVVFFGIGAYAVALVMNSGHPFWLGLIAGAVVAAVFAGLFGLPVLRLKGHYFAIATLGGAEAVREIIVQRDIGGTAGLASTPLHKISENVTFFYEFLALAVVLLLLTTWLSRSKFGFALVAIRENDQAAAALGIGALWYKVGAFVLSAIPTAIAGGIYAYWVFGFDTSAVFAASITITMVLATFLGGTGTILGPMLGAIAFEWCSLQFDLASGSGSSALFGLPITSQLLLGSLILIVTIFVPQGLLRFGQELIGVAVPGVSWTKRLMEGVRRVRRFITANGI